MSGGAKFALRLRLVAAMISPTCADVLELELRRVTMRGAGQWSSRVGGLEELLADTRRLYFEQVRERPPVLYVVSREPGMASSPTGSVMSTLQPPHLIKWLSQEVERCGRALGDDGELGETPAGLSCVRGSHSVGGTGGWDLRELANVFSSSLPNSAGW